jgi:ketosteroid isomerase-like protein
MRIFFLLFIVLSFSSVLFADMKSEIAALLEEQDQAWNRGDLDGFVKPYDDTGKLVFIGSSGVIRDPRALKEKYEKKYKVAGADFGKLTFSDLQVEELSKDLALAWGRWEVEAKGTKSSGWFSLIVQKTAGKWRILHDHSS